MPGAEIKIAKVGPIAEPFALRFPEGGGIVVLKGYNGAGKSTAQATVQRMLGGNAPLSAHDGEAKGIAEGMGVRLTIGSSVRRTGECNGVGIEGKFDLSKFVAPGVAEGEAADARRIKALLAMTGVAGSPTAFASIHEDLGLLVDKAALDETDIVEQARKIKASLERQAARLESDRDKERGRAEAALAAAGDISPADASAFDADTANANLERAVTERTRLLEQRRQHIEATERAKTARMKLAGVVAGTSVAECETRLSAADKALTAARDAMHKAQYAFEDAAKAVDVAKREEANTSAARAAIDAASKSADVTDAALQDAEAHVTATREVVQRGQVVLEARRHHLQAGTHAKEATRLDEQAASLRGAAQQTDAVLSSLIKSERIIVSSGRLYVQHAKRGKTLLADLSAGELAKIGIMEAVDAFRAIDAGDRMPLLVIAQELWQDLDPAARADIDAMARREHVCLLPAECSDGPLRAETFAAVRGDEFA